MYLQMLQRNLWHVNIQCLFKVVVLPNTVALWHSSHGDPQPYNYFIATY